MKIFIGSTKEGENYANELSCCLTNDELKPEIWTDNQFLAGTNITELLKFVKKFDFAVFILTADDEAVIRDKHYLIPRDNLIFEIGLFVATLGLERVLLTAPKSIHIKLPTDLAGIIVHPFDDKHENVRSAMNYPATQVKNIIHENNLSEMRLDKCMYKRIEEDGSFIKRLQSYKRIKSFSESAYSLLHSPLKDSIVNQCLNGHQFTMIIFNPDNDIAESFYKSVEPEEWHTADKINDLKECANILSSISTRNLEGRICDCILPYALMLHYVNMEKESPDDYLKIDLYSINTNDIHRRSIHFKRRDNNEHFKFFEDEFNTVYHSSKPCG